MEYDKFEKKIVKYSSKHSKKKTFKKMKKYFLNGEKENLMKYITKTIAEFDEIKAWGPAAEKGAQHADSV